VSVDQIAQKPRLKRTVVSDGLVKNGTLVKVWWLGVASLLLSEAGTTFYKSLVEQYAAFNPHACFRFTDPDDETDIPATDPEWHKWRPSDPTSPHWYTAEALRALIAAYVAAERDGNRARTVREFVSEFAGLSGSAKQKAVTEAAGLVGAYLHDLVSGDHIDLTSVARLLAAMREHSRPVKAKQLGEIGEAHLRGWLAQHWCDADSVTYRRKLGEADGVPFVLEVALGIHRDEYAENRGSRVTGLNWAPTVGAPIAELAVRVGRLRSRDLTNAT